MTVFEAVRDNPDALPANEKLFVDLRARWYPPTQTRDAAFTDRAEELSRIVDDIRTDPGLAFLDGQIFPEYNRIPASRRPTPEFWIPDDPQKFRSGFYVCNRMLQLMENVYLALNLEEQFNHPDNRGWMNLYKRWSWSGMFRLTWAICAGTYGVRFQGFCERRLGMQMGTVNVREAAVDWNGRLEETVADIAARKEDIRVNETEIQLLRDLVARYKNNLATGDRLIVFGFSLLVQKPYSGAGTLPDADFPFGFGLIWETGKGARTRRVVYFRIRDHIRKLGLGRKALAQLLEGDAYGISEELALSELPRGQDNLDPAAAQRYFERMFRSVWFEVKS